MAMMKGEFHTIDTSVIAAPTQVRQQGIGIIEVLIALVVVSLGVLGMASLQLTGMKHTSSGYNRSIAVLFSENLSSRIRSNPDAVRGGDYAGYDSADDANCNVRPAPFCQAGVGIPAQSCSAADMADFDLFSIACGSANAEGEFVDGLTSTLNEGRLQVECDAPCGPASNYTLTITWNEGSTTSGEETQDLKTVQVKLNP